MFVGIIYKETCAKFQRKIVHATIVRAFNFSIFFKIFNFSDKELDFSEIIELTLKFRY